MNDFKIASVRLNSISGSLVIYRRGDVDLGFSFTAYQRRKIRLGEGMRCLTHKGLTWMLVTALALISHLESSESDWCAAAVLDTPG